MNDYDRLRIALYRIMSGRHEDGSKLELKDTRAIAKVALLFTEETKFAEDYRKRKA